MRKTVEFIERALITGELCAVSSTKSVAAPHLAFTFSKLILNPAINMSLLLPDEIMAIHSIVLPTLLADDAVAAVADALLVSVGEEMMESSPV